MKPSDQTAMIFRDVRGASRLLEVEFGVLGSSSERCEDVEGVRRELFGQFDSAERIVSQHAARRQSIPSIARESRQYRFDTEYRMHADSVFEPTLNA